MVSARWCACCRHVGSCLNSCWVWHMLLSIVESCSCTGITETQVYFLYSMLTTWRGVYMREDYVSGKPPARKPIKFPIGGGGLTLPMHFYGMVTEPQNYTVLWYVYMRPCPEILRTNCYTWSDCSVLFTEHPLIL